VLREASDVESYLQKQLDHVSSGMLNISSTSFSATFITQQSNFKVLIVFITRKDGISGPTFVAPLALCKL
jgi:hypothetical protein